MKSVVVNNLKKSYGNLCALDGVTFDVSKGEIFGLIGPDGSGKTTLFRILTTLLLPSSGSAFVEGFDVINDYRKIREISGYMPGRFSLYKDLSVEENLNLFATVFKTTITENYYLIKDIYKYLEPFKKRRASDLSGGMKQKLALCCALIHKPAVLFLDEPTTGVDPVSRKEFWEMLMRLKTEGITIIVSTPYMDEADRCDRVALMQKGKFLTIDSPENITKSYLLPIISIKGENMTKLLSDIRLVEGVKSAYAFGDVHHVTLIDKTITLDEISQRLIKQGNINLDIKYISPGIEDSYMLFSDKISGIS